MNTQVLLKKAEDMKKKAKKNKKGFTLVELIVVLVIIAILAAVLVPTMSGYIGKAKKTAAESALKNVVTAANSAGTSLVAANVTVNGVDTYASDFCDECVEVGGSDVLKKVYHITLDNATGSVVYADYCDGKYSAKYVDGKFTTGKEDTMNVKTTADTTHTAANGYVLLVDTNGSGNLS